MDETEVLALVDSCSNVGRWGEDDGLGTLNHITDERIRGALALPRSGRVVTFGHDLVLGATRQLVPSAKLTPRYGETDGQWHAQDSLELAIHGFETTHMDAPAHASLDGHVWNGRAFADVATTDGLADGSIMPAAVRGVVTRGVFLDIAAARGVEFLRPGDGVGADDLEAAEERAGVRVGAGDAMILRVGHAVRKAREGNGHDESAPHEGVLPDVIPWMYERDVALYAGDCIELRPSGYPRVPQPLHMIGLSSMGLALLDVPDVETLAAACAEEGRHGFLFIVSPLRIPGGTGSAVNPLAIF